MSPRRLCAALAQRLGHETTDGLVEFLDAEKETMLNVAAERFERRLTEEILGLRVDLVRELHGLRADLFKWSVSVLDWTAGRGDRRAYIHAAEPILNPVL